MTVQSFFSEENKTRTVKITQTKGAKGDRYVISDSETGDVIDNAQGYGFKTPEAAVRYATPKGWLIVNPPYRLEVNI